MMKKLLILSMLIMAIAMTAQSGITDGIHDKKPRHFMKVTVDKVDNTNSDRVSRVSCTLVGVPHTSSKVDSVTAVIGGRVIKATDIDGIDFGRYFQWEDEGAIPVDVDLKYARRFTKNDSIKFHTIYGVYSAPLKKK